MPFLGLSVSPRMQEEPALLVRRGLRLALMGLGVVLMALGVIAFIAFLHTLGILLFAVGLVLALKNSFTARRAFIKAQRRHPKFLFPVRRLIRRKPEVAPVLWQQLLRTERLLLPRRFRFCRWLRLKLMRRRRAPSLVPGA